MPSSESFDEFLGEEVVDPDGNPVGRFACYWERDAGMPVLLGIYLDEQLNRTHVVPAKGAWLNMQQTYVCIAFPRQKVEEAPCLDCDCELDEAFEGRVYAYYGIQRPSRRLASPEGIRTELKKISPPPGPTGSELGLLGSGEPTPTEKRDTGVKSPQL